jgi:hypothetical protein
MTHLTGNDGEAHMKVKNTRGSSAFGRAARSRWVPLAAAATAAALTAAAIATAGGGTAGAATAPNAQSAGNFLDATIGGNPIDDIAKLAFARAQSPGSTSVQNPLDATVLQQLELNLTGSLQLPKLLGIDLGAANQTAIAKSDGQSRGSAGAVLNTGGVSVGGSGEPADATIDLCAAALSGGNCGTDTDALGRVQVGVGAVASIARTPEFGPTLASSWNTCTQSEPTCYKIAGLNLDLSSPLLASVLGTLNTALTTILGQLTTALNGTALPAGCTLTPDLNFDNGFITINGSNGSIGVSVGKILTALGLDLNDLPPNTDLLAKVLDYLTSPQGLGAGVTNVLDGLVNPLETALDNCNNGLLGQLLTTINGIIDSAKTTIESTVDQITTALGGADLSSLIGPLTDALGQILGIGINVQPQVSSGDFTSNLDTLPKQGMTPPPVPYEHTVRAIELQLLGSSGITVALANSSAGPSNPATTPSAGPTSTSTSLPPTGIPTGVPAGLGTHGGSPLLPLVLLALGVMFAGGGAVAYRMRGTLNRH